MPSNKKKKSPKAAAPLDKHLLYEASVQSVEVDLDLFKRVFRKQNKRPLRSIREDFCGTAQLCADWVKAHKKNEAWGVDLDPATLEYGRQNHLCALSNEQNERMHLVMADVLDCRVQPVDLVCALNFSYSIFKQRKQLLDYFRKVYEALEPGGVFVIDTWGGSSSLEVVEEHKQVEAGKDISGRPHPAFRYTWDQASFNFVDNNIVCHIHFKVKGQKKIKKAFTYDWRLYTLPELRDVMEDAGFTGMQGYFENWSDEEEESDGILRPRKRYEDMAAWVAYLVAYKPHEDRTKSQV